MRAVKTPRLCGSSELTRKEQRRLNAAANDANDERGGGTRRARAAAGGVVVVDRAVVVAVVAAERERSGRRQCTTGTTVSFILRNKLTPDLLAYFFSTAAVVCLSDLSPFLCLSIPHSFPFIPYSFFSPVRVPSKIACRISSFFPRILTRLPPSCPAPATAPNHPYLTPPFNHPTCLPAAPLLHPPLPLLPPAPLLSSRRPSSAFTHSNNSLQPTSPSIPVFPIQGASHQPTTNREPLQTLRLLRRSRARRLPS